MVVMFYFLIGRLLDGIWHTSDLLHIIILCGRVCCYCVFVILFVLAFCIQLIRAHVIHLEALEYRIFFSYHTLPFPRFLLQTYRKADEGNIDNLSRSTNAIMAKAVTVFIMQRCVAASVQKACLTSCTSPYQCVCASCYILEAPSTWRALEQPKRAKTHKDMPGVTHTVFKYGWEA